MALVTTNRDACPCRKSIAVDTKWQGEGAVMDNTVDASELSKSQHSKNAIFFFFVFAIPIFLFNHVRLFAFESYAFFFVGMFAISLLSMLSYLVTVAIARRISVEQAVKLAVPFSIAETAYDFLMTWLLFKVFVALLK